MPDKIVISASRRTDIPAFFMDWFMNRIDSKFFEVENPYNGKISLVPSSPDKVHTIVFWSKNFNVFLENDYGKKLKEMGYNLFFNFTINSESKILEPNVPPLDERIEQLYNLSELFGAKVINLRFDPLCFYQHEGISYDNLKDFEKIVLNSGKLGIKRLITSFMNDYKKIQKRVGKLKDFCFLFPSIEEKIKILMQMASITAKSNINLYTCCEKEIMDCLPKEAGINKSSCIPNNFLMELFGGNISVAKDKGQRTKQGCDCMVSNDIGSYRKHPCNHKCLFCYANPM
ncbi:MAG: DUF1848 domain-containing protein [Desulfobacterales bacterium]|nr:DUF1848 domain-containing protein [Desulfobacterales bacterium]